MFSKTVYMYRITDELRLLTLKNYTILSFILTDTHLKIYLSSLNGTHRYTTCTVSHNSNRHGSHFSSGVTTYCSSTGGIQNGTLPN